MPDEPEVIDPRIDAVASAIERYCMDNMGWTSRNKKSRNDLYEQLAAVAVREISRMQERRK